jgi:hypothetical protein
MGAFGMIKFLLPILLWTYSAVAGLPPTTSKGAGDSGNATTFNFQFPEVRVNRSGVTTEFKPNQGPRNYVKNPSATVSATSDVTASGTTVSRNTTNPLPDSVADFSFTIDSTSDTVTWDLDPYPSLPGLTCTASLYYTSASEALAFQVRRNSETVADATLPKTTSARFIQLPFDCGDASNATTVRIVGTSTTPTAVRVAKVTVHVPGPTQAIINFKADNVSYTPTLTGIGTPSNVSFQYARDGEFAIISGTFTTGTVQASTFSISLPPGLVANTSVNLATGGHCLTSVSSTSTVPTGVPAILVPGTSTSHVYLGSLGGSAPFTPKDGNVLFSSSTQYSCNGIRVPIVGWNQSTTANIFSSDSVYGGFYTSGNAVYVSVNNNTWETATNSGWSSKTFFGRGESAGVANNLEFKVKNLPPDIYEVCTTAHVYSGQGNGGCWGSIYDGQNRSALISVFVGNNLATDDHSSIGCGVFSYDTTADRTFTVQLYQGTNGTCRISTPEPSGSNGRHYFYIRSLRGASRFPFGVAGLSPRSESFFYVGNGHGSTNTKIRNFSNVVNVGTAITGQLSSTNGASWTINTEGIYEFTCSDSRSGGGEDLGFSVNSTQLSTNIGSISQATPSSLNGRLAICTSPTGLLTNCNSGPWYLPAGSVVRPHTNGSADATTLATCKAGQVSN